MAQFIRKDRKLFHKKKNFVLLPETLAPLADTHTHLTAFNNMTAPEAIARARMAGVELMVVPIDPVEDITAPATPQTFLTASTSCWPGEAERVFVEYEQAGYQSLSTDFKLRYLVGAHPYSAGEFTHAHLDVIDTFLQSSQFVGIGEIGLDYNCDVPKDLQKKVFREQLALAKEKDLPVELHLRNQKDDELKQVHRDAFDILKADGVPEHGCILHCFTETREVLERFTSELGTYIAFGGAMTFKSAPYIREALLACPEHLMVSETDAPYMAPVPLRGQECECSMVAFVVDAIATLREEAGINTRQESYDALWNNANRIFCS